MNTKKIEYFDEEVLLEATVCVESQGDKKPVVLIFPAWEGKSDFTEQKAAELAKLGFVGCALDPYGKGILGHTKEECEALMSPLIKDRAKLQKRILSYLTFLPSIPEADLSKVAVIGYCFGGLCALDLARSGADIKGAASFHGLLHAPKTSPTKPVSAKILAFHGYKDPMVSQQELLQFMKEMEEKQVDFQLHFFGKAMHAFTNPKANDPVFGTVYNQDADKRSWEQLALFLTEIFA